jgi:uncharacterized protein YcbK (DUF882 family)
MSFFYKAFGTCDVELSRRYFIRLLAFSGLAVFAPRPVFAAIRDCASLERSLSLYNPNTKEALDTIYWSNGNYLGKALADINYLMRDRLTGEIKPIDTRLLDLLYKIGMDLKTRKPFHIISGYRSPKTNALLRKRYRGAAKNSFHMQGEAVDVRLPGCRLSSLRRAAFKLKVGGVGYYPRSRFVHIDVGPVRYWSSPKTRNSKK